MDCHTPPKVLYVNIHFEYEILEKLLSHNDLK